MFVATVLSAPARSLSATLVEEVRAILAAGAIRWLAEGQAAEVALPARAADEAAIWSRLQAEGVDFAIQPAAGRRKRLLIADMDSTVIGQECIDELAAEAGIGDRVAAITARAMNGELDFEDALRERVHLLQGLSTAVIDHVLQTRIHLMPGARTLLATMRANGAYCALVSGGFTAFASVVADRAGFDMHRANVLLEADGLLTGEVARPILGREAKVETLRAVAAARGLSPADAIAVGDGANDLDMLAAAGTGVALHAKPGVQAQARISVNHGDLTALLYLQGYAAKEFVASDARRPGPAA